MPTAFMWHAAVPELLVAASAAVALALGGLHLVYTFTGTKLHPRDGAVLRAMQDSPLVITRQTTMWQAWVGFNASHSLGAILFGLIYGYLALMTPELLFDSWFLRLVGLLLLTGYAYLCKRYWFSAPMLGITVSSALYIAGMMAGFAWPPAA